MNKNVACTTITGVALTFLPNSNKQNYQSKLFEPYNTLQFTFTADRSGKIGKDSCIIVIVEIDLPLLTVNVPPMLTSKKLNFNDNI